MNLHTQMIIKNNPNLHKYLREYSYWYKYLNRDPSSIKQLETEMKQRYKLTTEDKISKVSKNVEMISSIVNILNYE